MNASLSTSTAISTAISTYVTRLLAAFVPQPSVTDLTKRAYMRVASTCAMNDKALFSWNFLQDEGADIVDVYLDGGISRARAAQALARKWNENMGNMAAHEMRGRMGSTSLIADDFLTELSRELNSQYTH